MEHKFLSDKDIDILAGTPVSIARLVDARRPKAPVAYVSGGWVENSRRIGLDADLAPILAPMAASVASVSGGQSALFAKAWADVFNRTQILCSSKNNRPYAFSVPFVFGPDGMADLPDVLGALSKDGLGAYGAAYVLSVRIGRPDRSRTRSVSMALYDALDKHEK